MSTAQLLIVIAAVAVFDYVGAGYGAALAAIGVLMIALLSFLPIEHRTVEPRPPDL